MQATAPLLPTEAAPPDTTPHRSWLWFNLLSLDAPAVSVAWQALFARSFHAHLAFASVVALFLTVWLIYVADRLLDGLNGKAQTARHRFYIRHRSRMLRTAAIALTALCCVAFFLSENVLRDGLLLALSVFVYLLVVHVTFRRRQSFFPKEIAVGVLFGAGTLLAPTTAIPNHLRLILPAILFAALCCLNCICIQIWESQQSGFTRFRLHPASRWLGTHLAASTVAVCGIALATLLTSSSRPVLAAIMLSAGLLCGVHSVRRTVSLDAFRVLADIALLVPALLFICR